MWATTQTLFWTSIIPKSAFDIVIFWRASVSLQPPETSAVACLREDEVTAKAVHMIRHHGKCSCKPFSVSVMTIVWLTRLGT
jgi:hypothetical protein